MAVPWADLDKEQRAQFWATLAFRHTLGLGPRTWTRLLRTYGSAYTAFINAESWEKQLGIPASKALPLRIGTWREKARKEWDRTSACRCSILLWHDPLYPELLRQLPDAPALLYCLGDTSLLTTPSLGVVGARRCTNEGIRVAENIARQLSRSGITIISGLARGIDRVAHSAALSGPGKTVAVLGTGIDVVYPDSNADIFKLIEEEGLIVSEFAPGTPPRSEHFPIRNRIISGLSQGILVVEATMRSGSLITARLALEQNRNVYAVPGPTSSPASRGCQELVRQGAYPVFDAEDILRDMAPSLKRGENTAPPDSSCEEKQDRPPEQQKENEHVLNEGKCLTLPAQIGEAVQMRALQQGAESVQVRILHHLNAMGSCHVDDVCATLGLPSYEVSALLTQMEVAGQVLRLPGARYAAATDV